MQRRAESPSCSSDAHPPAAKRRRILSLSEKFTILNRLAAGESSTWIAREYDVAESAIRRIGKQQATIRDAVATLGAEGAEGALRQRNLRLCKMESCLLTWLEDMRAKRLPVWCSKVCAKALQIYEEIGELGYEDSVEFLASFGWFTRFRKKFGLAELRPHADRSPVSEAQFIISMKNMIREYKLARTQIFMAERFTFWWKRFPGLSGEESVSLIVCSNASGDYITVHRPQERENKVEEFRTWFQEQFVPEATEYLLSNELPEDFMLVLATDQSYPQDLYENGLKIVMLPPECNSSLLPAVLGIIEHLNAVYLKNLAEYLVSEICTFKPLTDVWRDFSLDQGLQVLAKTVPQLHKITLTIAWIKLLQDHPGRSCNEVILQQIVKHGYLLKMTRISIKHLASLIKPAELTAEEVIELFHKQQQEREPRSEAPPPEDPVDPLLIPEIDRHVAALHEAKAFFEANDQNGKRQEAISKRLDQVTAWALEMRQDLEKRAAEDVAMASGGQFEEVTIKEEPVRLDSDSE